MPGVGLVGLAEIIQAGHGLFQVDIIIELKGVEAAAAEEVELIPDNVAGSTYFTGKTLLAQLSGVGETTPI